ncbi:MAG: dNTP triphosphohydrolase [Clostridium butyricum]|nr:dNTP triphosphohydrolase [Clostridium butyricum]
MKSIEKLEGKVRPSAQRSRYVKRVIDKGDIRKNRTEFQRDWERIIHAKSFRRLEDKAQIYTLSKGDHFRTRLTHTLEVAQIARGIARELNLNEDLVQAIALGHDLGHTPFGHVGERTLNEILENEEVKGGFKHNFQGVKVVNYLEEKYGEFEGIDLTYQVIEGILKHTKVCSCDDNKLCNKNKKREGLKCKNNNYQIKNFLCNGEIEELHLEYNFSTTLEGQAVAIADEIAQRAHDLDDGIASGIINEEKFLNDLKKMAEKEFYERLKIEIGKEIYEAVKQEGTRKSLEDIKSKYNDETLKKILHEYANEEILKDLTVKKDKDKYKELIDKIDTKEFMNKIDCNVVNEFLKQFEKEYIYYYSFRKDTKEALKIVKKNISSKFTNEFVEIIKRYIKDEFIEEIKKILKKDYMKLLLVEEISGELVEEEKKRNIDKLRKKLKDQEEKIRLSKAISDNNYEDEIYIKYEQWLNDEKIKKSLIEKQEDSKTKCLEDINSLLDLKYFIVLDDIEQIIDKMHSKKELDEKIKEMFMTELDNIISNSFNENIEMKIKMKYKSLESNFKDELYNRISKSLKYIDEAQREYVDTIDIKRARIVSDVITYFIAKIIDDSEDRIYNYENNPKNNSLIITEELIKFGGKIEEVRKELEKISSNKIINSEEVNCFDGKGKYVIKRIYKAYNTNPMQMSKTTLKRIFREVCKYTNYAVDITDFKCSRDKAEKEIAIYNGEDNNNDIKIIKHKVFVRCLVDLIAGMTDDFANRQYDKLYSPRMY